MEGVHDDHYVEPFEFVITTAMTYQEPETDQVEL
jgi:hypothetical protein